MKQKLEPLDCFYFNELNGALLLKSSVVTTYPGSIWMDLETAELRLHWYPAEAGERCVVNASYLKMNLECLGEL